MSAGKNPFPNENNTGHFWDDDNDIRELSNRPPRWYMFALYMGLIAVVVYSAPKTSAGISSRVGNA